MKKTIRVLLILVIFGLMGAYGVTKMQQLAPETGLIAQVAPDFTLPSLAGGEIKLSDYKGKLVLLNFWASWCHPCRKEIPDFINIQHQYKDKPFTIVSISIEDKVPTAIYAKTANINYPIAYGEDAGFKVGKEYGLTGVPYNVLIAPDQKIIAIYHELNKSRLANIIDKQLKNVIAQNH